MKTRKTWMRSLFKTVSWRMVGAVDTFVLAWLLTGHIGASAGLVGFEALTKAVWYFLHERVWEKFGGTAEEMTS